MNYGVEKGAEAGFEKIDAVLRSLQARRSRRGRGRSAGPTR
jgi:hypothetical protein